MPAVVVQPARGWRGLDPGELWRYRELLYFLAWRDVKVRYKQTAFGAAWAVLQPFLAMLVFSVIFGRLVGVPSDGAPYPLFAYVALLPWTFFAAALSRGGTSLVSDAGLISKVYLPRLVVPVAAVLALLVDLAVALVLLLGLLLYFGLTPPAAVLTLPLFLALAVGTALGAGLWLSALHVRYRDVAYVVPFLTQVWFFLTPVVYPGSLVPERWRPLYGLNPMVGVVEGFRWALLGTGDPPGRLTLVSAAVALVLLAGGLCYFRRVEDEFADLI